MELISLSPSMMLSNLCLTAFFIFGSVEYSFRMKIIITVCVFTAQAYFMFNN